MDYLERMNKVMDISHPEAESIIKADRLRTKEAQKEDIEFMKLQISGRLGRVTEPDKVFQKTVSDKLGREQKFLKRKHDMELEEKIRGATQVDISDTSDTETDDVENKDADYKYEETDPNKKRLKTL